MVQQQHQSCCDRASSSSSQSCSPSTSCSQSSTASAKTSSRKSSSQMASRALDRVSSRAWCSHMGHVLLVLVLASSCLVLAAAQDVQEQPFSHCSSVNAATFGAWCPLLACTASARNVAHTPAYCSRDLNEHTLREQGLQSAQSCSSTCMYGVCMLLSSANSMRTPAWCASCLPPASEPHHCLPAQHTPSQWNHT